MSPRGWRIALRIALDGSGAALGSGLAFASLSEGTLALAMLGVAVSLGALWHLNRWRGVEKL